MVKNYSNDLIALLFNEIEQKDAENLKIELVRNQKLRQEFNDLQLSLQYLKNGKLLTPEQGVINSILRELDTPEPMMVH